VRLADCDRLEVGGATAGPMDRPAVARERGGQRQYDAEREEWGAGGFQDGTAWAWERALRFGISPRSVEWVEPGGEEAATELRSGVSEVRSWSAGRREFLRLFSHSAAVCARRLPPDWAEDLKLL